MKKFIENKILIHAWVPDASVGFMEKNQFYLKDDFCSISTPTIYRAIHYGLLKLKKENTRRMLKFEKSEKDWSKNDIPINKKDFSSILKTITTDNGSEFASFHEMIQNTNTSIYFCHPYCSGEKGSNEKNNSLIRYFIPKGSLIENYSNEHINSVAFWINHYPRKILHYSNSYDEFVKHIKNTYEVIGSSGSF